MKQLTSQDGMNVETQTYDPDGDLVFILSKIPLYLSDQAINQNHKEDAAEAEQSDESDGEEGNADDFTEPETDQSTDDVDGHHDDATEEPETITIHAVVSSKHMMLASPIFKAMLQRDNFKEGKTLQETGKVHVPLPDDDADAFAILLNIIHGRTRKVPRQIELTMMTEISILVDKYDMLEIVENFSDAWLEDLKMNIPVKFNDAVGPWVGISWVFGKRVEFKAMTALVLRQSYGLGVDEFDERLPIPEMVCSALEELRDEAFVEIFEFVEQTIRRYKRWKTICPRTDGNESSCNAMLLGSLLRSATSSGLYPLKYSPYEDQSFDDFSGLFVGLRVEALCDRISRCVSLDLKPVARAHGFYVNVDDKIAKLRTKLGGLDIDDYKAPEKKPTTSS